MTPDERRRAHTEYMRRYRDARRVRPSHIGRAVTDRFWEKVDRSGECWVWIGGRRPNGYGAFYVGRRKVGAHRVSYQLAFGVDPGDLDVLHRCDNPPCVRPDHLWLGTPVDNALDARAKGRLPGPWRGKKLSPLHVEHMRQAARRRAEAVADL
jgi:hypothetical protein